MEMISPPTLLAAGASAESLTDAGVDVERDVDVMSAWAVAAGARSSTRAVAIGQDGVGLGAGLVASPERTWRR